MQKIVNELINNSIKGVDTYRFRDATWLIFTKDTRWVVELTDEGTLWFNYKFFDEILRYVSLNPKDDSEYVTGWAKEYFLKPLEKLQTFDSSAIHRENKAVSVVQRGVKKTEERGKNHGDEFEWHTRAVIGKGIKKADGLDSECKFNVRNVMNHGIKNIYPDMNPNDYDWSDQFKTDKVISDGKKVG